MGSLRAVRRAGMALAALAASAIPAPVSLASPEPSGRGEPPIVWESRGPSRGGVPGLEMPLPRHRPHFVNGRFLLLNMHGALFHPEDFAENVAYARWMNAGVIRVFATDSNTHQGWSGTRVASQIAALAPTLRANEVQLIVALVNNHKSVPGELPSLSGWMDGYHQLLLPFYEWGWRGAYLTFVRDLVGEVRRLGAADVIFAWELGNEIHTPTRPEAIIPFIYSVSAELRQLDPERLVLPGSMGANHLEPWKQHSAIARWLYCEGPIAAYTLHAYDFVTRARQGDMPVDWDLDYITAWPCPSGRRLPVLVEELGTSRVLPGLYTAAEEQRRLELEFSQIRMALSYNQVAGIGAWSGESPRVRTTHYQDNRRGLTSYGLRGDGEGSCYPPPSMATSGARCQLEQVLRQLPELP